MSKRYLSLISTFNMMNTIQIRRALYNALQDYTGYKLRITYAGRSHFYVVTLLFKKEIPIHVLTSILQRIESINFGDNYSVSVQTGKTPFNSVIRVYICSMGRNMNKRKGLPLIPFILNNMIDDEL